MLAGRWIVVRGAGGVVGRSREGTRGAWRYYSMAAGHCQWRRGRRGAAEVARRDML